MSLQKLPLSVIEIDRPITKEEGSVTEMHRHLTIPSINIAIEFFDDKISEFKSIRVIFLDTGAPLYLKENLPNIFPTGELRTRKEAFGKDFVDFVLDNISREKFFKTLRKKYEVNLKFLSKEKKVTS